MGSLKRGKNISASIENITLSGIWLFTGDKEYFLGYENYPWFKEQPLRAVKTFKCFTGIISTGRNWMLILRLTF